MKSKLGSPLFTLLLIGLPGAGLAGADDETQLEEMVVTASRTAIPADEVGSAITVITGEQLKNRQVRFVSDVLREVPGLSVSRTSGVGTFTQVRIRGAEANQTLILIDGVEANDVAIGSDFDFAHLLASDIERIEVLRGPQSALWGSDALAGVINISTKRGRGSPKAVASVEGGSFGTLDGGASVSGGGDRYHFALSGSGYDTDGINTARNGSEDDGYNNTTASFKGGVDLLKNLAIDVVARHTDATTESDDSVAFGIPVDADIEREAEQTYARFRTSLGLFGDAWQHTLGLAITDTDNEDFTDGAKTGSTDGRKIRGDYQTNISFDTPAFADAQHTFSFAFDGEQEDFSQRGEPTPFGDPNQDQDLTNIGHVLEYRLGLWDQLFLSGSARYDHNDEFKDATTYRFTAAVTPTGWGTRIHGSYGKGVKNPTFFDRFGFFEDQFVGNPDLKPESSIGWDIGVEQALLNDRLSLGATYFDAELDDEIDGFFFDPALGTSGAFTAINLDGTSKRMGVELSLRARLFEDLDVTGAYTYTDSTEPGASGRVREVRRPEHVASLVTNWRLLDSRANLNIRIDYNGEQKDSDFRTFPTQRVTLDDFVLVNVSGSYDINPYVRLFARIENLLDQDYEEVFGFQTPGIAAFGGVQVSLDL